MTLNCLGKYDSQCMDWPFLWALCPLAWCELPRWFLLLPWWLDSLLLLYYSYKCCGCYWGTLPAPAPRFYCYYWAVGELPLNSCGKLKFCDVATRCYCALVTCRWIFTMISLMLFFKPLEALSPSVPSSDCETTRWTKGGLFYCVFLPSVSFLYSLLVSWFSRYFRIALAFKLLLSC